MAPLYATQADFEAYVPGWVTDDALVLARYLELAERDVEGLFSLLPIITTGAYTGHRFDTASLTVWELRALKNAICAQADYLIRTADEGSPSIKRIKGPDFEIERELNSAGRRSRFSPDLPAELIPLERFRARTARARA